LRKPKILRFTARNLAAGPAECLTTEHRTLKIPKVIHHRKAGVVIHGKRIFHPFYRLAQGNPILAPSTKPIRLPFLGILLSVILVSLARSEPLSSFNNGEVTERVRWLDTDGNIINAHDGGILFVDGKYYWYGMELRPFEATNTLAGGQKTTAGVVMYSSKDLYNWKKEGVVLACSADPKSPLKGPMRFERPKIIYNDATKKYVMWFHYVGYPGDHGVTPGTADAGVATCDTIDGHYAFLGFSRPIDEKGAVKDCTLFKDDDGSAYFIYDRLVSTLAPDTGRYVKNRGLYMVKLSSDYLTFTTTCEKISRASNREAPVMLKHDGYYFLITSETTGWKFNCANYYCATNILGPYTLVSNPCTGPSAATTCNSQGTCAFGMNGEKDEYIFVSERHHPPCMTDSSYIFWPVTFPSPSTLRLPYLPTWKLAAGQP
jgi:beta-galactosidase